MSNGLIIGTKNTTKEEKYNFPLDSNLLGKDIKLWRVVITSFQSLVSYCTHQFHSAFPIAIMPGGDKRSLLIIILKVFLLFGSTFFSLLSWYLYEEEGMLPSHTSYMHLFWKHFLYLVLTKLWKKWLVSENLKWLNRILMTCKVILIQTFITVLSSKTWFANTLIIILTVNRATQMISILTRIAHAGALWNKVKLEQKRNNHKKIINFLHSKYMRLSL